MRPSPERNVVAVAAVAEEDMAVAAAEEDMVAVAAAAADATNTWRELFLLKIVPDSN
jgi:hypothetical protein